MGFKHCVYRFDEGLCLRRERPRSASRGMNRSSMGPPQFSNFKFQSRELPNKYSKKRIAKEYEDVEKRECTFQPKINEYVPQQFASVSRSKDSHIDRLAKSRRQEWEARDRVRMEAEEQKFRESCTFKPNLVSQQAQHAKITSLTPAVPVEVRLINEANNKHSLRERAKRHIEEQELIHTCTFKPKINATSRYLDTNHRPLHERVGELQREKRQRLQQAKVREERSNPDLTFKPTINEKSQRIAGVDRSIVGNVTQRLVQKTEASLQKKLRKMAKIALEREQAQSFRPATNPNSDRILTASDKFANKTFFERQEEALAKKTAALALEQNCADFTFKPQIGTASEMIAGKETLEERLERLAYKHRDLQKASRESVQEQYYSQFTFQPKINKISKALGNAHSVEELHTDAGRRERMEDLVRQANEAQELACTFRPDTRKKGRHTASMYDLSEMSRSDFHPRCMYLLFVTKTVHLTFQLRRQSKHQNLANLSIRRALKISRCMRTWGTCHCRELCLTFSRGLCRSLCILLISSPRRRIRNKFFTLSVRCRKVHYDGALPKKHCNQRLCSSD